LKAYSLVGKKLVECNPEALLTTPVGMLVDEKDEMIRLIFTTEARKKQRELLTQLSAEFNKNEHAGTYLVSHLENPDLVKSILAELKTGKPIEEQAKLKPATPSKKKAKKGKSLKVREN